MADTPTGETVTPEAPSNSTGTTTAPVTDNSSADVEAAKKEAEQARMRANQLENELKKVKDAEAAAKQKQLEEKEEFKTLYEQTQSQLDELKRNAEAAERQAELSKASQDVLKEYPQNVQELAKTAGLTLTDDSEEAVKALKDKLDTFKNTLGTGSTPRANNPRVISPEQATHEETMAKIRGGDKQALSGYIQELPAIKRMKEIAQNGA